MRTCYRCKEAKPIDAFSWRNKAKGTRNAMCMVCGRKRGRDHYQKNKAVYIAKAKRHDDRMKEFVKEAKNRPCADCGQRYPHYVMDFDHLRDKDFCLSKASRRTLTAVKAEIAKCEAVCANCHRQRTYRRTLGSGSTLEVAILE